MQTPDLKAFLQTSRIQVENLAEIQNYMGQHPDMLPATQSICEVVKSTLGNSAGISLAVYRDPEINDSYLILQIRRASDNLEVMDGIETISEKSRPLLAGTSGKLFITTDFHPIG